VSQLHARCELPCRAKVNDGDPGLVSRLVQEQIFRFQIAMNDVVTVAVVDRRKHLFDNVRCVLLAKLLLLRDALKKFATVAQSAQRDLVRDNLLIDRLLSHKKVALCVLEELVELQNVWVVHLLQDADLAKKFLVVVLFEVLFVDDFDCSQRIRLLR